MQSQVALLIQDAFLQLDAFSVPGVGTFRKKTSPHQEGLAFSLQSPEDSQAPDIRSFWQAAYALSPEEAQQQLKVLQADLAKAFTQQGRYVIPGVGALQREDSGQVRFVSLGAADATDPRPGTWTPTQASPAASPAEGSRSAFFPGQNRLEKILIAGFALVGLLIIAQAAWSPGSVEALSEAITQEPTDQERKLKEAEKEKPLFAEQVSYRTQSTRIDSPLLPLKNAPVVATSRPQSHFRAKGKNTGTGTQFIQPPEAAGARLPAPQARYRSQANARTDGSVDIGVLDTGNGQPAANQRMASPEAGAEAHYHLISGSFNNYSSAQTYADQLRAQGKSPRILTVTQGNQLQYRVSIFSHAYRERVEIHKQALLRTGQKAGWIYSE
jgi:cell division protein FtsN